ncbi:MAG: glycerophosphodiester phosphodiesterase [Caldithrix sp.]|nr:glycerophosphodiester phosphodiesterase [Caldithrix sp.]
MQQPFKIIAHRGASYEAPENTMAAIRLAWQKQADAVEVDVHLSKDGQVVVIHDAHTRRTVGLNKDVRKQTFAELQQLDAGSWKDTRWQNERIPSLHRVLDSIPPGRNLFIEIKGGPACLPAVQADLHRAGVSLKNITIMDFNFDGVRQARELFPHCNILWLLSLSVFTRNYSNLLRRAADAGIDGLNFDRRMSIDQNRVDLCRKAGLTCYVWTVNNIDEAHRFRSMGISGITTDRPGWMREQLQKKSFNG